MRTYFRGHDELIATTITGFIASNGLAAHVPMELSEPNAPRRVISMRRALIARSGAERHKSLEWRVTEQSLSTPQISVVVCYVQKAKAINV
jgi:hypothetical protein